MQKNNNLMTTAIKLSAVFALLLAGGPQTAIGSSTMDVKSQRVSPTGLFPRYPKDSVCPALSSLFGTPIEAGGSNRTKHHVGVDGGRRGDMVIAPADGEVIAVWETNSGWGMEWSILIQHTARDLNLPDGNSIYYSEFNHLNRNDLQRLTVKQSIKRGQFIGKVDFLGGDSKNPAEVHWKVFKVPSAHVSKSKWVKNELGSEVWWNDNATLIDPLYMLSLNERKSNAAEVRITPFSQGNDYSQFRGFSYIFECKGPPPRG